MDDHSLEEQLDLSMKGNHRDKDDRVLPYSCRKGRCEEAFVTNTQLQKHWKENHIICVRCNGVYANSPGLKLHQKKCVDSKAVNLPSFDSIDLGVGSIQSKNSRTSEILSTSSSLRSNDSRHAEDYVVTVMVSCKKPITPDMRHVIFALTTASVALVFAAEKDIATFDEAILENILSGGQLWFQEYAIHSDGGGPDGSGSPSLTQGLIPIDLGDVSLILTYSPEGVSNPPPEFSGRLNRNKLIMGLMRFSKEHSLCVLQVGNLYMALVLKNDFLYVFNPGIGTSKSFQDLSDLPEALASVKKCYRRGWHDLVDDLILLFRLENNFSDQLEFVIMPAFISKAEEG